MRVLLTYDGLLNDEPGGAAVRRVAAALRAAGEQVQMLTLGREPSSDPEAMAVICDPVSIDADLMFPPPAFAANGQRISFTDLTDEQLAAYRDVSRVVLDGMIERFEPHLIHAQHVWLQGHLALESGVPYVLTAWGDELALCRRQGRYAHFAEQAAENTGLLVAVTSQIESELLELFPDIEQPFVMAPATPGDDVALRWLSVYRTVLEQRFGNNVPD